MPVVVIKKLKIRKQIQNMSLEITLLILSYYMHSYSPIFFNNNMRTNSEFSDTFYLYIISVILKVKNIMYKHMYIGIKYRYKLISISYKINRMRVRSRWTFYPQVLPFLLRRNKEDVLQDLPPKITQDYYCDLSPLQCILYEDFRTRHSAAFMSTTSTSSSSNDSRNSHVFEALRYLRNVCNHPKLVLNPRHPLYQTVRIYG